MRAEAKCRQPNGHIQNPPQKQKSNTAVAKSRQYGAYAVIKTKKSGDTKSKYLRSSFY
jgi:hypothetical protein